MWTCGTCPSADAPAPLIARQTIPNPGQVPIRFKVEYNRDDISPRNTYSVQADIVNRDGRLAFTNDTAHEVVTRGNPRRVDMVLALVQPPPEMAEEAGPDWRTWVEAPARIARANLMRNEPEPLLHVGYYQSTTEGCARPGNEGLELAGNDIVARVTLMQPPSTPWAIPCDENVGGVGRRPAHPGPCWEPDKPTGCWSTAWRRPPSPSPGKGCGTPSSPSLPSRPWRFFSRPVMTLDNKLRVLSGMPRGSGCSQFNGYEIGPRQDGTILMAITHHEAADPFVVCTADYPVEETNCPPGFRL